MRTRLLTAAAAVWLLIGGTLAAVRLAVFDTIPITMVEALGWVVLAAAPIAFVNWLLQHVPPRTVAQVLYDAERTADPARQDRGPHGS